MALGPPPAACPAIGTVFSSSGVRLLDCGVAKVGSMLTGVLVGAFAALSLFALSLFVHLGFVLVD